MSTIRRITTTVHAAADRRATTVHAAASLPYTQPRGTVHAAAHELTKCLQTGHFLAILASLFRTIYEKGMYASLELKGQENYAQRAEPFSFFARNVDWRRGIHLVEQRQRAAPWRDRAAPRPPRHRAQLHGRARGDSSRV